MTNKEICILCTEYAQDAKCDIKDKCKLIKLNQENRRLKKEITQLKKELFEHSWDDPKTQGNYY